MFFRPCIDLHQGKVKQIVGGSLGENDQPETNFQTDLSPAHFAKIYKADNLRGGHIIKLGPGNEDAARAALAAWPGGMQIGGGINPDNAADWLDAGASHVIVTSWVFRNGKIDWQRLEELLQRIDKERLVLDISCRKRDEQYLVVTDRWQKFTTTAVDENTLKKLAAHCDEFLVHAVDVEGKQQGIDEELLRLLAESSPIPTTYAGGVRSLNDMRRVWEIAQGRIGVTVGSALDLFGGDLAYTEAVALHSELLESK